MANGLTPKQARFVEQYLVDLNATQAAIRAGYAAKNADVQGPRLLGNVGVAAAIEKAQSKLSKKTEITIDGVIEELRKIGLAEDEDVRHGDRIKALELVGKHLGAFITQKHELTGADGKPITTSELHPPKGVDPATLDDEDRAALQRIAYKRLASMPTEGGTQ